MVEQCLWVIPLGKSFIIVSLPERFLMFISPSCVLFSVKLYVSKILDELGLVSVHMENCQAMAIFVYMRGNFGSGLINLSIRVIDKFSYVSQTA